jgi:hypothetical protein
MRRPAPLQVVAAASAGNNDSISREKLWITFSIFTTTDVTGRNTQHVLNALYSAR